MFHQKTMQPFFKDRFASFGKLIQATIREQIVLVALFTLMVTFMMASKAFAGTDGTEFQNIYTTIMGWSQGYLGKLLSLAIFLTGTGIGVMRQSLMSIVSGIGGGAAVYYTPGIIDSVVSAVM